MSRLQEISNSVNQYITDCNGHRSTTSIDTLHEGTVFDKLPLIFDKNPVNSFNHEELLHIVYEFTRAYRGAIHNDHRKLWSWVAFLVEKEGSLKLNELKKFGSLSTIFKALVHTLLGSRRINYTYEKDLQFVNKHLLYVRGYRYEITAPLCFSLLEGLLKRANDRFVSEDGIVKEEFEIIKSDNIKKQYKKGDHLSNIGHLFQLYYKQLSPELQSKLNQICDEVMSFQKHYDNIFSFVSESRNEVTHGEKFWRKTVPYIMNLICFVVLGEINSLNYLPHKIKEILSNPSYSSTQYTDTFPSDLGSCE